MRKDNRANDGIRPVSVEYNFQHQADGSVLIKMGNTHVLCAVSVEEDVPPFLADREQGWITAEYGMLPGATNTRNRREVHGRSGRTMEIQRLIGRALRASVDLEKLGPRTVTLDCDVIQADGGTRTAAISGAFVALSQALAGLRQAGGIEHDPIVGNVASVSVGIYDGTPVLDLDYAEDSSAETDMNVVMDSQGRYIEIQGTAEGIPFSDQEMSRMLDLARAGIAQIISAQNQVLGGA